ncbi:Protein prickle [Orchesella cincta]|uniref:Protein prickle n=1 Tax=Orchesella cincta TaxID=48709 RepID=A0A1D2MM87_ORCCI|nr:Protein prickle [Orchesella cincta]
MSSEESEPCPCPCHRGGGDCHEVTRVHRASRNVPANPFIKREPKPAAACISSSFLHAKHIVQTMKARWESFSEKESDIGKSNSLPCAQCASNIRWSRRSIDKSDQQETKGKYEDNKPAYYSLEPLHRNNSRESMNSHYGQVESNNVGNNNSEDREYSSDQSRPRLGSESNIFDKPSRFVDAVGKMSFDLNHESETLNLKRNGSSLQLHPTNPFSSHTTGVQTYDEDEVHNEINLEESHSTESKVKNIGKSFEAKGAKVGENVNRKSLEMNSRNWRGEPVGGPSIYINDSDDDDAKTWNIENQDREENEWKVNNNTTSAQNVPSNYNVPPPRSLQSQVRAIRDSFEDDLTQVVDGVERTPFHVETGWKNPERRSLERTKPKRNSYPQESTEGLVAVEVHNLNPTDNHNHPQASPRTRGTLKTNTRHKKPIMKDASTSSNEGPLVEGKESTYVAWISLPSSKFTEDNHSSSSIHNSQEKTNEKKAEIVKSDVTIGVQEVDTKSSFALEMDGRGIRRATLDSEDILDKMVTDYNNVILTPSHLQVEAIDRSISVTNAAVGKVPLKARTKRASSGDAGRGNLGRNECISPKACHKIVEKNEASFHLVGGFDTAWHRHCFRCHVCEKELSEDDHSFFEDKPYCIADYINVAKIQKCFKCHELIFDSTYTSASGHFWHREHFTCQSCKKSLVDTKYVLVRKKYPYCFYCHEKDFPKFCKICQGRISPQEPYVQSGETFWHSNDTCLHCSSCKRSLVGRSLFFRKDGLLYCNRYCAVREI